MEAVGNRPVSKLWFELSVVLCALPREQILQLGEVGGCLSLPMCVSAEGPHCGFSVLFMEDRAVTNAGVMFQTLSSLLLTPETK